MKMQLRWQLLLAVGLVLLAVLLHTVHFLIFGHLEHLLSFLGKKIAFVPLEVLFVTLIIHQLLTRHEHSVLVRKMNMLVGSFFSEIGNQLLAELNAAYRIDPQIRDRLKIGTDWTDKDFDRAIKTLRTVQPESGIKPDNLETIRQLLQPKRQFLLLLLGNPNLLEHEPFTDLLWATFHLLDELSRRDDLHSLPEHDLAHLSRDAQRVYQRLLVEWVRYMKHLKQDYPYLYSLEMRINPFDEDRSVVVEG
jgi:branched-subunit amino acid transport protein